ncbi:DHA2 family efflux MFS transporter permease subunit [Neosynechococcus sphagnicola]|uniref:DHA2 family efflux MFS transporter permease subunit n=1 Tax=Neosynechococcus sphagnicola TaxID=1501145 RepID=UPI00056BE521|nr:DHA2 family efflux MFS transporter permease subunit [Neosynechococcus sphagnicola]
MSAPESATARHWWALISISLGFLMYGLDTMIVNIALPTLAKEFDAQFAVLQWVIVSYLLVITALTLSVARLGDMFGKRGLFLSGMVLFTLSSLLCGLAPSVEWLIGFRVLEGLGAVLMAALGFAIVAEVFPSSQRGQAIGIAAAILSVGSVMGPTIGGLLLKWGDWRSIFLINVPIGIIASVMIYRLVPASRVDHTVKQRFDGWGALVFTVVMVSFSMGMTAGQKLGFTHPAPLVLLTSTAIALGIFLWIEQRMVAPMLDLSLFRRPVLSLSLLGALVVYTVVMGRVLIFPFFLQLELKLPTEQVGLLMVTAPLLSGIITPLAGRLADKVGTRPMSLLGLLLLIGGCLLVSGFDTQLTSLRYMLADGVLGIGLGMWRAPNNTALLSAAPVEQLGMASGLATLAILLGQTIGVPFTATLFFALARSHSHLSAAVNSMSAIPSATFIFSLHWTFVVMAGLLAIMGGVTTLFWPPQRPAKVGH